MISDPVQLFTVFVGIVLLAMVLVRRFELARKMSPVLLILTFGAVFSNFGIITDDCPFYHLVIGFTVPFAVCLVLFQVRLEDLKKAGPAMLVAFTIASMATIAGTITASLLLDAPLQPILGQSAWKISGPYVGTYIGGSLNFFALWSGLEIGNPDLFAAANAVDNLTVFPIFLFWILAPDRLARFYPVAKVWRADAEEEGEAEALETEPGLNALDIAKLSFIALVVMTAGDWINAQLIAPFLPSVPTILLVTTFALILAQFRFVSRLEGAGELGNLAFYVFFAAVGAMINVVKAVTLAPILFAYVMIIITFHVVFLLVIGRVFHLDVRVLAIAAVATKSGPPTVLAVAQVKGWRRLVLPGIAAALLGYAVGNYAGFGAAYFVKFLLGQ